MEPEAGPSQLAAHGSSSSRPNINSADASFVAVPGLSEGEGGMRRSSLSGTQDLLGAFDLIGLYDQVVRPYVKPLGSTSVDVKGKGKAEETSRSGAWPSQQPSAPDQQQQQNPETIESGSTPAPKKMPRGYAHIVADLPGTYSTQRDNYLRDLSKRPDFHPVHMQTFDQDVLRSAFALEEGSTPEVDAFLGIYPTKKKKSKRKRETAAVGAPPPISTAGTAAGTPIPPTSAGTPQQQPGQGEDEDAQGQSKKRKTVRLNE